MIVWILTICTSGWVLCGQEIRHEYPSEAACYRALDDLYKRNNPDKFKYITCSPKKDKP